MATIGGSGFATVAEPDDRHRLARDVSRLVIEDDWFAGLVSDLARLAAWRVDPGGGRPPVVAKETLRHLNASLRRRQDVESEGHALTTSQVIRRVDGLNTRASVHARLERGQLLAFKATDGRTNLFPEWQFQAHGPVTVPVIDVLVEHCRLDFAGDVIAFDLLVREPLDRLGSRSVADLLVAGEWAQAVAAVEAVPEQDG